MYRRKVHTTHTFFYPHNSWNKGDAGSVIELKIWDFFPNTSGPIFGFSWNIWSDIPSKMALHLCASTSWVIPSCCWSHLGLTDIENHTQIGPSLCQQLLEFKKVHLHCLVPDIPKSIA